MGINNLIPNFLKPVLKPIYHIFCKIVYRQKSRDVLHEYWKQPWDGTNLPQEYVKENERSEFLLQIFKKYATSDMKILEIGCNVGRNLNCLFQAGFTNLETIEISEKAIQLLKQTYPEMANHTKIYNIPVEEIIKEFKDSDYDIIFTMAVLEHIHKDSEWIFSEMVRATKDYLIAIEDENVTSWRHFPRNYKKIFESFGLEQVEEITCSKNEGLDINFMARIFKKPTPV